MLKFKKLILVVLSVFSLFTVSNYVVVDAQYAVPPITTFGPFYTTVKGSDMVSWGWHPFSRACINNYGTVNSNYTYSIVYSIHSEQRYLWSRVGKYTNVGCIIKYANDGGGYAR